VIIDGSITVGIITEKDSGEYKLDQNGRLFEGCVIPVNSWCTGIMINGKLMTGIVKFNFDESFDISSQGSDGKLDINLSLPTYKNATVDIDIDDIIRNLLPNGLVPITSINGVKPDENGNIRVVVGEPNVEESAMLIKVADDDREFPVTSTLSIETGEGALIIRDIVDKPDYDANAVLAEREPVVEKLLTNCNKLTDRTVALERSISSVEYAVNLLSTQLTRMK
jgi:hypothetical protein